jgi:hypothetical protein
MDEAQRTACYEQAITDAEAHIEMLEGALRWIRSEAASRRFQCRTSQFIYKASGGGEPHGWGLRGSSPRAPAPVSEPDPAELLDVPGKTTRRQWLLAHHFVSMAPAANPTAAIHQSALKRSPKLG